MVRGAKMSVQRFIKLVEGENQLNIFEKDENLAGSHAGFVFLARLYSSLESFPIFFILLFYTFS